MNSVIKIFHLQLLSHFFSLLSSIQLSNNSYYSIPPLVEYSSQRTISLYLSVGRKYKLPHRRSFYFSPLFYYIYLQSSDSLRKIKKFIFHLLFVTRWKKKCQFRGGLRLLYFSFFFFCSAREELWISHSRMVIIVEMCGVSMIFCPFSLRSSSPWILEQKIVARSSFTSDFFMHQFSGIPAFFSIENYFFFAFLKLPKRFFTKKIYFGTSYFEPMKNIAYLNSKPCGLERFVKTMVKRTWKGVRDYIVLRRMFLVEKLYAFHVPAIKFRQHKRYYSWRCSVMLENDFGLNEEVRLWTMFPTCVICTLPLFHTYYYKVSQTRALHTEYLYVNRAPNCSN